MERGRNNAGAAELDCDSQQQRRQRGPRPGDSGYGRLGGSQRGLQASAGPRHGAPGPRAARQEVAHLPAQGAAQLPEGPSFGYYTIFYTFN